MSMNIFRRTGSHYGAQVLAQQRMMAAHAANKSGPVKKAVTYTACGFGAIFGTNILANIVHQLGSKGGKLANRGDRNWFLGAYDSIAHGVHESFYTVSKLYNHFKNKPETKKED